MEKETTKNLETKKSFKENFWINIQVFCLILTVCGQIVVGPSYIGGQIIWFIANVISAVRNYVLKRPRADKIRDNCLTLLTLTLIVFYFTIGKI